MPPEGVDFSTLLHKINFIMSRIYNVFTKNTCETVLLINKTGVASVKGLLVRFDSATENGFILTAANEAQCIGAIFQAGIPDGSPCLIARSGSVQVMLKNATASAPGNWVKTSDVAGRADASLAAPPGGGIPELGEHMQELGHTGETNAGGTDQLIEIEMHPT